MRRRMSGVMRGLAVLLLVLQAGADGAIAVAHAGEPLGAPTAIESQHTARCVILHDAARCVQCQHHATRTLPAAKRRLTPAAGLIRQVSSADRGPRAPDRPGLPTSRPRAPPSLLS